MFCRKRTRARRGFTLIELMVVIVIIGLIAGTVTVGVRSYMIRGKQNVAKMEISKIAQAIESFYLQYDRIPTNEERQALSCAVCTHIHVSSLGCAGQILLPHSGSRLQQHDCLAVHWRNRERPHASVNFLFPF